MSDILFIVDINSDKKFSDFVLKFNTRYNVSYSFSSILIKIKN